MKSRIDFTKPAGIAPDQPPVILPDGVFSDSRNVRYRDGAIERASGYSSALGSLSATAIWLANVNDGVNRYWVYASNNVAYATDGTTHANITGSVSLSASDNLGFTGGAFHGHLILNDGVNIPQSWVPSLSSDLVSLTAWPSALTTQVVRFFGDFIWCARNTTSGVYNPREVRWSDKAQTGGLPQSWDYTDPTNQAGITELGQTPDEIVDMAQLRNSMIVYKGNSTWIADYVGSPDVFGFRQLFSQAGLLTENCIATFNDMHFIVSDADIIIHDGNSPRSVADGRIRRWFFSRISSDTYRRTFVSVDYQNREILVCFPEGGYTWPNIALCWNWSTDTWDIRELGQSMTFGTNGAFPVTASVAFDSDTGTFDAATGSIDDDLVARAQQAMIMSSASSPIALRFGAAETFNGSPMTCYAERRGISLSSTDLMRRKRIKRILPLVLGTAGETISFYVGTRESVDGTVRWNGPYRYTIGTDHKIDVRLTGRFVDFKVEYTGSTTFRFFGADLEFDMDGTR